jgi:hypothetical protein
MAENVNWSKRLINIPIISGEEMDNFVKKQAIAKETSLRGYKFFIENYIHDIEGLCDVLSDNEIFKIKTTS